MIERCNHITPKMLFTTLALAGIALLSGCGSLNQSPLAPDRTAAIQAIRKNTYSSDGPVYLTLSPKALPRAAKPIAGATIYTERASGWFSPDQEGKLRVSFPRYADAGDVQVKRATFEVEKGTINGEYKIVMQVFSGYSLNDVWVEFSPEGLEFAPPATLTIVLRGKVDPSAVQVYHLHGGAVEQISANFEDGEKTLTITVKVPGFSGYTLGGQE